MQKIVPHLWFDTEAREAAEFYVAAFGKDSKITSASELHDTPSGDVDVLSFTLWGYEFQAISAGPYFKFNPSISISVQCETEEEIDRIYNALIDGGTALMALEEYPWSKKYAWLNDRYGLSWQLNLPNDQSTITQRINPAIMFVGDQCGNAEEAMGFYVATFPNSEITAMHRYEAGQPPDKEGTIAHGEFTLSGELFMALDSAREHDFAFNEAVSLIVNCKDQAEVDYYFEKLSAVPESEQCGWLKDKYGVSWQIVPTRLGELMNDPDTEKVARVTKAFLQMKKLDIAALEAAAKGA